MNLTTKSTVLLMVIMMIIFMGTTLAQQQDQNNGNGQRPPRPRPSGQRPPRPDHSGNMPPPPRPQDSSTTGNEQDDSKIQDGNGTTKTQGLYGEQGLPIGVLLGAIGGVVVAISLCLACGAGVVVFILKKKGFSISLKKNEDHQPLREEEDETVATVIIPSQQTNPVAYSINQVHYPTVSQEQQV